MDNPRVGYDQNGPGQQQTIGMMGHGLGHVPYAMQTSGMVHERNTLDGVDSRKDISDLLQQIMTITDQSLDEAQARLGQYRIY